MNSSPPYSPTDTLASAEATTSQRRLMIGICAGIGVIGTALLPFASVEMPAAPEVVPFYIAGVILTDLVTAFLLFGQFHQSRSTSLLVLACTYLFTGLIVIPHLLSFPDFSGGSGLFGGLQTSAWLWHFWHLGFPIMALAYLCVLAASPESRIARDRRGRAIALASGATVAAVAVLTVLAANSETMLPLLHDGRSWNPLTFRLGWAMGVLTVAAFAGLWLVTGGRTVLHLWLAVALIAFFFDFTPNLLAAKRYSLGWYVGRGSGVVASSFLLIMFLLETNRLYRRLGAAWEELGDANRRLERRVDERTRELQSANRRLSDSVAERSLLLREIYHRVKNNLQVVDSLLVIRRVQVKDAEAREAMEDLRLRIHALGLVHQQLMLSEDMETFDVQPFLEELCSNLGQAAGGDPDTAVILKAGPFAANLDFAIPLGLLVTELVTNALRREGGAEVMFGPEAGRLVLEVAPRAGGAIIAAASPGPGSELEGLPPLAGGNGMMIVKAIVAQLDGRIEENGPAGGARISMPPPKPMVRHDEELLRRSG